jgi:hypothetical protein
VDNFLATFAHTLRLLRLRALALRVPTAPSQCLHHPEDNQAEPEIDYHPEIDSKRDMLCARRQKSRQTKIQDVPTQNGDQGVYEIVE